MDKANMTNNGAYRRAKKRVALKMSFFIHLTVYLSVMSLLLFINIATWDGYPWFIWPLAGWGLGMFIHGLVVFLTTTPGLSGLKKRMIEEEMRREAEWSRSA